VVQEEAAAPQDERAVPVGETAATTIKLGYTIHLNLPATSDIAVFDAIFKSLRANLM
jgi:hypothetical protein